MLFPREVVARAVVVDLAIALLYLVVPIAIIAFGLGWWDWR